MSKSKGNALSPQDVVDSQGADILRLWVVASNYEEDLRFGPEILKHQSDAYRRLRNTLRYLLGNLDGFDERERVRSEERRVGKGCVGRGDLGGRRILKKKKKQK